MANSIHPTTITIENYPFIIDVRENNEYVQGHIPHAIHIPLNELPSRLTELEKEKEYFFICHSGVRSQMACDFFKTHGYQGTNIAGGMLAWEGEVEHGKL